MKKIILLCLLLSIGFLNISLSQGSVDWVLLPNGTTNGNCVSNTDVQNSVTCYGLNYTPGYTGDLTTVEFYYFIDCDGNSSRVISNSACSIADNSFLSGCNSGLEYLQANGSANGMVLPVVAGQDIIVYQICLDQGFFDTINVMIDPNGFTASIDLPNGGVTDMINTPTSFQLNDSVYGVGPCENTTDCSLSAGTDQTKVEFPFNANNNILDASAPSSVSLQYDVYDEVNEFCQVAGGQNDTDYSFSLINTYDQYGHAVIDATTTADHRMYQNADGIVVDIPFGTNMDTETSAGDVRGFRLEVNFASHLSIDAHQLTVDVAHLNRSSTVFNSAAIIFLDENNMPFDSAVYNGYYATEPDLSGNCKLNQVNTDPWTPNGSGMGVVLLDATTIVDMTMPCSPAVGTATQDTLHINARTDAGLDSAAVVGGYIIYFLAEDVAAPATVDDGSGTGGDDGVKGNAPTSINTTVTNAYLGYTVDGCVFEELILPVEYLRFDADELEGEVLLEWVTSEEVNHSHFEVEWGIDGRNFIPLDRVVEGLEDDLHTTYQYYHVDPLAGNNYYRLKQVDLDGRYEYSEIEHIVIKKGLGKDVVIFPNPFNDHLTINLNQITKFPIVVKIIDIQGRLLQSQTISSGVNTASIDIEGLPNGPLILMVDNQAFRVVRL